MKHINMIPFQKENITFSDKEKFRDIFISIINMTQEVVTTMKTEQTVVKREYP